MLPHFDYVSRFGHVRSWTRIPGIGVWGRTAGCAREVNGSPASALQLKCLLPAPRLLPALHEGLCRVLLLPPQDSKKMILFPHASCREKM